MYPKLINVSVIITTLNEAHNLARCINSLKEFEEIIVVDSGSQDETIATANQLGARVENFKWNGEYPKKRQWCLDTLKIKHDFVFFVDADEELTRELIEEIKNIDFKKAGYFVKGDYMWQGIPLSHSLKNNKLALFHKDKFEFPIVKDLGEFNMGEMEGHYQPVLKTDYKNEKIGQLKNPLRHFSYEDKKNWDERHIRYAHWEAGMIKTKAYPKEVSFLRGAIKEFFRKMPCRGDVAFIYSYIYKLGFLDGRAGFDFARSRRQYYRMVNNALKASKV